MKPKKAKTAEPKKLDVHFCTECGSDLDDFDFKEVAKNKKDVESNWKNCIRTAKFKGDMCAKMFIANEDEKVWDDENSDDED